MCAGTNTGPPCSVLHTAGWFEVLLFPRKQAPSPFACLVLFWVRPPPPTACPFQLPPRLPLPLVNFFRTDPLHEYTTAGAANRIHTGPSHLVQPAFAMRNARAGLEAIIGLIAPLMAGGACLQSSLSIDTTALTFSGCYQQSMYAGLYETLVWTIDGRDIAPTGTKAISASHVSKRRVMGRGRRMGYAAQRTPRNAHTSLLFPKQSTERKRSMLPPSYKQAPRAVGESRMRTIFLVRLQKSGKCNYDWVLGSVVVLVMPREVSHSFQGHEYCGTLRLGVHKIHTKPVKL